MIVLSKFGGSISKFLVFSGFTSEQLPQAYSSKELISGACSLLLDSLGSLLSTNCVPRSRNFLVVVEDLHISLDAWTCITKYLKPAFCI
jgi:hypothetical protein